MKTWTLEAQTTPEHLSAVLDKPDITYEEILAYLAEVDLDLGMAREEYIKPQDLPAFASLQNWWPKGSPFPLWWPRSVVVLPPYLERITLRTAICQHRPASMMYHQTFAEQARIMWSQMCDWLIENKIDPVAPNESQAERSERLAKARYERTLAPRNNLQHNIKTAEEIQTEEDLAEAELDWRQAILARNEATVKFDLVVQETRMEVKRLKAKRLKLRNARMDAIRKRGQQSEDK